MKHKGNKDLAIKEVLSKASQPGNMRTFFVLKFEKNKVHPRTLMSRYFRKHEENVLNSKSPSLMSSLKFLLCTTIMAFKFNVLEM